MKNIRHCQNPITRRDGIVGVCDRVLTNVGVEQYVCRSCLARVAGSATSDRKKASSAANGRKGGRPRKIGLTARDVTVSHEPPDGWWIDLPFGWVIPGDAHGIVADTKREAIARLSDAVQCDCARCTSEHHD